MNELSIKHPSYQKLTIIDAFKQKICICNIHSHNLFIYNLSIYILIKVWSPWLIDCMLEAVHTNPGCGMATLIHNFWDFWELFFVFARKLGWIFMHPKPYLRIWIFKIKYYINIRVNFLSYFNVNVYFITIIHYLNK